MLNIRPVSDLRNKYPEIEDLVLKQDEVVYLTKNGYGSMVVMSIEKYSKIMEELNINDNLKAKYKDIDINDLLNNSEDELDNPKTKYLSHEEVIDRARRTINEQKKV